MTQLPILVPASKLTISPSNVRTSSDPAADAQLKANIATRGILQNLIGAPVSRKKGHFRITAGGRRLSAIFALVAEGVLDPDHLVPVLPLADAKDAIEISLSENFFRLAMNPADACRAFQDIIQTEGKTAADVAKRFGLTERFVLGRLRLASLAPPVFQSLADGEITLDVAIAYASTSDTERQAIIFERLNGAYHANNSGEIRRQLAAYSYRASDPRAIMIGRDAYLSAGGRIDADLFCDSDSEAWLDTHLVDTLVEQRLAAAAEEVRARDGFAEVRIVTATHVPYAETYDLQPLRGELPPLDVELEARQADIEAEIVAIETAAGDAELSGEDVARIEALEEELGNMVDRDPILTDEQRRTAIAYVVIGHDGVPRLHDELYEAPAAEPADVGANADSDFVVPVQDAEAPKSGISQRLGDELALMKTEILAVHVASQPGFACDLGTFIMAEAAMRTTGSWALPSDLRAPVPSSRVSGFESETRAARAWTDLSEQLDQSWAGFDTLGARYDAFCALPAASRAVWLGWLIARTLHAVPVRYEGSAFLDHLGSKLAVDVADWWRPTARTYFDRIPKPAILNLFEQIGGPDLRGRHHSSKKHDLAAAAERLFAGDAIIEADRKAAALAWLPDEMRFARMPDPAGDIEQQAPLPPVEPEGSVGNLAAAA